MRQVTAEDIEDLAVGAAVLGAGGGGDPYLGKLMAKQAIEEHGPVSMVAPGETPEDGLVIPSALMGAPTVAIEKIPEGNEAIRSLRRLAAEFDEELYGTMPIECGGINSTIPFAVAAREGLPLVDADGMGRAFPELQHETFNVYGVDGTPAVISDEKGNQSVFRTEDNLTLEAFARAVTIEMGGVSFLCDYPMTGQQVRDTAIPGTISFGMDIGAAIRDPPVDTGPLEALKQVTGEPITTENLQYGYRVRVIGIPAPEIMRSGAAIDIWGPQYFGYDVEYVELERRYPAYYREHGLPEGKRELLE